jgi:ring-1,2-phenylacetyl-CoA epoxidase subunit PaaE
MSINAGFHRLPVAEVRRETADAVSIRFDVPQHLREAFAFKAGQHLTLKADIGGEDVRRTYSLCVAPSDGEFRIAVKKMPGGRFSTWANTAIKAGQVLEVLPPMGRFVAPEVKAPTFVALAGGSGITPVISILKTVLQENVHARATLLYGNRDSASIIFLEELAALKNRFLDRLEVYHFLENEAEEIELFNGRLDKAKCEEVFGSLVDVTAVDAFFICGPGPMMDAAEAVLLARGVPASKILVERFTTSELSAEQLEKMRALEAKAAGTMLTVTLDGRRSKVAFDAARGNILESVQAAGLPAPYACKGGVCSTCRAKVTAGTVAMKKNYALSEEEVADGYVLTCQSVPTSADVTLNYDA